MNSPGQVATFEPAIRHRYALCRTALDAGIRGLHLGSGDDWWPELAPLTRKEREAVKTDLRNYGKGAP